MRHWRSCSRRSLCKSEARCEISQPIIASSGEGQLPTASCLWLASSGKWVLMRRATGKRWFVLKHPVAAKNFASLPLCCLVLLRRVPSPPNLASLLVIFHQTDTPPHFDSSSAARTGKALLFHFHQLGSRILIVFEPSSLLPRPVSAFLVIFHSSASSTRPDRLFPFHYTSTTTA